MRLLIFMVSFICCAHVSAQHNSDYKTVAKQRIKTATATKAEFDKIWVHSYTYDTKGRIIIEVASDSEYEAKTYVERRYATTGQMISSFYLGFMPARSSYIPVNGEYILTYDTSSFEIVRYDSLTGEQIYYLNLDYEWGKRIGGRIFETGDSIRRSYSFENGEFVLTDLAIKYPVDTLKRGYAETEYNIGRRNIFDPNSPIDTSVHTSVFVLDRRGREIKYYGLLPYQLNLQNVVNPDGTWYSQLYDSSCYLKLYYTYKNSYRWDGSLKSYTCYDHVSGAVDTFDFPRHKKQPGIISLEEIMTHGTVTYEYY